MTSLPQSTEHEWIRYKEPGPVAGAFIADRTPYSGLIGPVGSGKSVASIMKMMSVALRQQAYKGVRHTRHVAIRNTYDELKRTTIKSFLEWFPEGPITTMNWGTPLMGRLAFPLSDGTRLECEVYFLSADRPEDVGKLRSFEATTAWLNESSELPKAVWDMASQRVGRFPPKRWGGATWSGVFMDSNPMDDDHWVYTTFEELKPDMHRLFKQPGALMMEGGFYVPNPKAENVQNHQLGYDYWLRQVPGKTRDWCKVFLEGQYGTVMTGKPVYPEWNDSLHVRVTKPQIGLPLLLGFDYGLTPACVIGQVSPLGQVRVFADLWGQDMGITSFARDVVKPFLATHFHGFKIQATGDPAGNTRADSTEKTCFMALSEAGIPAMPCITNEFTARREAVAKLLGTLIGAGEPRFALHPDARNLRKGFNGGYHYKRIQTAHESFRDIPEKNMNSPYSHVHDALQYLCVYVQTMHASLDFGKKIDYPRLAIC